MELLNYNTLEKVGYKGYILKDAPEKVLQFGEGNFLRAFVDYFIDIANEKGGYNGKVVMLPPRTDKKADAFNAQDCLYTLYMRGSENGKKVDEKRVISAISRCLGPCRDFEKLLEAAQNPDLEIVVSNTTEAGIAYDSETAYDQVPPKSFPGKLTRLLHERFKAGQKGLVILSCELIDHNGEELQKIVNKHIEDWQLGADFQKWVNEENLFCNTLVDRIVPGGVADAKLLEEMQSANGYEDKLIDVGECFAVWIIEGPAELEDRLPFKKAGLGDMVKVVPDVAPYKKRKVSILNGAHTGSVLGAYLAGEDIVRDAMHNDNIRNFMNKMLYEEVIPTLPLDKDDCMKFASAVADRFDNPFIDHALMSISLNSTSKWAARNMPSFKEYINIKGELPACLTMSLAAYIAFYSNDVQRRETDGLICKRAKGNEYKVQDDAWILDFYYEHRNDSVEDLVKAVLSNVRMWGKDLTAIAGLETLVAKDLKLIRTDGAEKAFASCL